MTNEKDYFYDKFNEDTILEFLDDVDKNDISKIIDFNLEPEDFDFSRYIN